MHPLYNKSIYFEPCENSEIQWLLSFSSCVGSCYAQGPLFRSDAMSAHMVKAAMVVNSWVGSCVKAEKVVITEQAFFNGYVLMGFAKALTKI